MNKSKRALQVTVGLLSLLPLTFGLLGLIFGVSRFLPQSSVTASLDSQFRFLSAWYLGLAMIAWWMIPNIERHTTLFRIVCLTVFLGGLARLLAWYSIGPPDTRFIVVLAAELMFPVLIFWQSNVTRNQAALDKR